VDVGVFAAVIAYLFMVTLAGIAKVGIRVLWLTLFKLRRRSSPPQGLMLVIDRSHKPAIQALVLV
jgi:LMBR1 domain-containing protein 1